MKQITARGKQFVSGHKLVLMSCTSCTCTGISNKVKYWGKRYLLIQLQLFKDAQVRNTAEHTKYFNIKLRLKPDKHTYSYSK